MKIVRVQYTTTLEYAGQNMKNITNVANEVKKLNHPGIKYAAYLMPDGKTFMHFDQFENEEAHELLTGLDSFKKFAAELEKSMLETEPKLDLLTLVAASYEILG
jgi:quinol monooxygenase YgiN